MIEFVGEMLLFDLTWVLAGAIVAVAATLQTITGFGFAIISVPLLLLVYDARAAVILSMLVGFCSQALLCCRCYRDRVPAITRNLLWGTLLGLPPGAYCLLAWDTSGLKLLANTVVLIFSLALLARLPVPDFAVLALVGFLVGVLTGTMPAVIGITMPVVIAASGGQPSLSLAVLVFIYAFSGHMLTPTHLCLPLTTNYFGADWQKLLRMVALPEAGLLAAALIAYAAAL